MDVNCIDAVATQSLRRYLTAKDVVCGWGVCEDNANSIR